MIYKKIVTTWDDFVSCGSDVNVTDVQLIRRMSIVNIFTFVGIITLIVFGFVNSFSSDQVLTGQVELGLAALGTLNLVYLRQQKKIELAAKMTLAILVLILLLMLVVGGFGHTGIYWFGMFPILSFFMLGKRNGVLWLLGVVGLSLTFTIASKLSFFVLSFSDVEIHQALVTMCVEGIMVYAYYTYIHQQDQDLLVRREQQLLARNKELVDQIKSQAESGQRQRELINTIDQTITEVQTKNVDLENAKLATMNILEDLAEEKGLIQASEAKDKALLESIGEGMIATDDKGLIIIANRQAQELLGYSEKQMVGNQYTQIMKPTAVDDKPVALKEWPLQMALSTHKSVVTSDYKYVRKNGTTFPAAITASPIEHNGKQIGGIAIFRDITKEKQIDLAKTEFVSLASHQLRTPLSAIGWYVEMLLSGDAGELKKEQLDYLQEIQKGSKRLVNMVNSLLNVSRIELGTFMVEPKPTNPIEIADAVLGEVKALIMKKKLVLKTHYAKDVPIVNLDAHLMQIVLQNLVSNAVKYTPDKGTIDVSVGVHDDALVMTVADTGIGIPKDQMNRIFEKLFRADNVRASDTDGTGLGLYMVKQILNEIDGTVKLESVLNKGTTITTSLPLVGMKHKSGTRRLT